MLVFQVVAVFTALFGPLAAKTRVNDVQDQTYPLLEAVYRDIHVYPELGFEERRTANLFARQMRLLGFDVTEKIAKTDLGVPSFYFGIGGLDPMVVAKAKAASTYPAGNHHPAFATIPQPAIRTGVTAMTLAVLNVMGRR